MAEKNLTKKQYLVLEAHIYKYAHPSKGIGRVTLHSPKYRYRIFADMTDKKIIEALKLQKAKQPTEENTNISECYEDCIVDEEYYDFPKGAKRHEVFQRIDEAGFSLHTSARGENIHSWTFTKCKLRNL